VNFNQTWQACIVSQQLTCRRSRSPKVEDRYAGLAEASVITLLDRVSFLVCLQFLCSLIVRMCVVMSFCLRAEEYIFVLHSVTESCIISR